MIVSPRAINTTATPIARPSTDLGRQDELDPVHGAFARTGCRCRGADVRLPRTLPTISNSVLSTLTAYISLHGLAVACTHRLHALGPDGSHCSPRTASLTLSVSVDFAFSTAALRKNKTP